MFQSQLIFIQPNMSLDSALEVFTHSSIKRDGLFEHPEFGDRAKLTIFGGVALSFFVTQYLFEEESGTADDLVVRILDYLQWHRTNSPFAQAKRNSILTDSWFKFWVDEYGLASRVRIAPIDARVISESEVSSSTPPSGMALTWRKQETRAVFFAYIGAVLGTHGIRLAAGWIEAMVEYHSAQQAGSDVDAAEYVPRPSKRRRYNYDVNENIGPLAAPQDGVPYLILFNAYASQINAKVEFYHNDSGPDNNKTWRALCFGMFLLVAYLVQPSTEMS